MINHSVSPLLSSLSDQVADLIAAILPSTVTISGHTKALSSTGSGSGWVYDSSGHIVTNAHVVKDLVDPLRVKPAGKPQTEGVVVGIDQATDLAVIKINDPGLLTPIEIRKTKPRLGEFCIAIGSPLKLLESASLGIISGLSRQSKHPDGHIIEEMLQTDASVNPGNSGGPLIDSRGMVLGVNTLGMGETVNFAVPAETVLVIVPELIEHGHIKRGSLGISVAASWVSFRDEVREMIEVRSVSTGDSPLRPGDCFLAIDSTPIEKRADIQKALNRASIGRVIEIELLRNGKPCKERVVPELKKE